MEGFKSGFVSIVGKTNVGKSTLLNTIIGSKVAITANKEQTTRTAITGILNEDECQIVFVDTPGIHKSKSKLGEIMLKTAYNNIQHVDVILFLMDATKGFGLAEELILEKLKNCKSKVFLVINKVDLIQKDKLLEIINACKDKMNFNEIIPISSKKKKYTDRLVEAIKKVLPEGPMYYEKDEYTDQTSRMLAEEIIREKSLKFLQEEIPHGIYVEVDEYKNRRNKSNEEICDIIATIYCVKEAHKKIIIGKDGSMLKRILTASRLELESMLEIKVNLKVWVKPREDWLNTQKFLKKFEN